jgi:hypothetical protein
VVVIDPGVGGPRRAIAAKTQRALFVGPDNGVLSPALANEEVRTVRLLENHELFLDDISRTFHGRDIFAPVAAHLSTGMGFRKVGPRANSYVELNLPKPAVAGDIIRGEILHIDRFGNAISNIPQTLLPTAGTLQVWVNGRNAGLVEASYDAAPAGTPVSVIGSTGYLEIAINGGSAAMALGLTCGTPIRITRE